MSTNRADIESNNEAAHLQQLVNDLGNGDGIKRRQAREALEEAGTVATPYLIEALKNPDVNVRWEAAKALGDITDPKAGSALVESLMDESFEVQWLAAEALIELGRDALEPLLEGLLHNYGSLYMRQGAHHVLHDLERRHLLEPLSLRVLHELRCIEPLEPYPVSARRALQELRGEGHESQKATLN